MPQVQEIEAAPTVRTGAALMFKGSGFYITDYRSDGYKKAADADKSSSSSSSSSESKSDKFVQERIINEIRKQVN